MPFKLPLTACGHLEATTTSSVQSIEMLKDNILNACDFQQRLLLAYCSSRRYNNK